MRLILLTLMCLVLGTNVMAADQVLLKDDLQGKNPLAAYKTVPDNSWTTNGSSANKGNISLKPATSEASVLAINKLKTAGSLSPGYTVKMRMMYNNTSSAPPRIVLLGSTAPVDDKKKELNVYGYELTPVSEKGALALHITALYKNGKPRQIDNMSSGNWSNVDLTQWAQITARVDIDSISTRINFTWEGKDKEGETITYSVTARDTSVNRFTSGEAVMLRTIVEESQPEYLIDDISVERLPEPMPVYQRPQGG